MIEVDSAGLASRLAFLCWESVPDDRVALRGLVLRVRCVSEGIGGVR